VFEIGGLEILVIAVVALLVLGPEKLPDVALKTARLYNQMKRGWVGVQRQVFSELALKEEAEKKPESAAKDGSADND